MTELWCKACEQWLLPTAFAEDKARSTGRRYRCRACSSKEFRRWQQTPGYVDRLERQKALRHDMKAADPKRRWAQYTLNAVRARSRKKQQPCGIDEDWLYANAPETCPLLGIALRFNNTASFFDSATVDRKNSDGGYTKDNCWIISMKANRIKTDATIEELEQVAKSWRRLCMDKSLLSGVKLPKRYEEEVDYKPPVVNPYAA